MPEGPLNDVVRTLEQQRRFIEPTVRNLDTGETLTVAELPTRVPKGFDPKLMSKDARRYDIGSIICGPFVNWIPHSLAPNTISYINHITNWVLLLVASVAYDLPPFWKIGALLCCAWLNFLCMMLDCLDGMHARNTNQCSKIGEVLDHWMDSVHVPLVGGGLLAALGVDGWAFAIPHILNACLYNAQLVVYYFTGRFVQTSGVEGQIGTSGIYVIAAFAVREHGTTPLGQWLAFLVPIVGTLTVLGLMTQYAVRFDRAQGKASLVFFGHCCCFALLRNQDCINRFEFIILTSAISLLVTGNYVICSVMRIPFKGNDLVISGWACVMALGKLIAEPIPLRLFVSKLVKLGVGDFTLGLSFQQLLPWFAIAHLAHKALWNLWTVWPKLKKMK